MLKKDGKRYLILKSEIISYIKDKGLAEGDKLPKVQELIEKYKFSYATVNRTLIELENEGIIRKHQGKGIFVGTLPGKENKCIGLIMPSPVSEFKMFANILNGIKSVLEAEGYNLLISISNMNHSVESENITNLIDKKVDGLIIFLEDFYRKNYEHIAKLKEKGFPFVLIDRYIPELETDYVIVNNKDIFFRICSYLKYKKNCRKILYVPDPQSTSEVSASEEKIFGYKEAVFLLYGKDSDYVIDFDTLTGKINELSGSYSDFGICFNHDGLVIEFIRKLKSLNIDLPTNCHLFGYNNSHEPWLFPTVEQFNDKIGSEAARLIIEKINNKNLPLKQIKIDAKLILENENNEFSMES